MKAIYQNQVINYLKFVNFQGSRRICHFAPESAMADGLIDFGTKNFVVAIIAKPYSQDTANNKFDLKFLETELQKLECLLEDIRYYDKVLALFVAFLNNTFNDVKGNIFPESTSYQKGLPHLLLYPVGLLC